MKVCFICSTRKSEKKTLNTLKKKKKIKKSKIVKSKMIMEMRIKMKKNFKILISHQPINLNILKGYLFFSFIFCELSINQLTTT